MKRPGPKRKSKLIEIPRDYADKIDAITKRSGDRESARSEFGDSLEYAIKETGEAAERHRREGRVDLAEKYERLKLRLLKILGHGLN